MYRMTQNVAMKGNTIEITHSIAQDTDNEQKRIEEAVKKYCRPTILFMQWLKRLLEIKFLFFQFTSRCLFVSSLFMRPFLCVPVPFFLVFVLPFSQY